ncbi:hypothetical protein ACPUEK_05340 [Marinomonas gallaica]|uniref:hypothetical protein n=1 Tax=Marinomonas gallaica TaxID=1806667 RepID=UPI003CE552CF
MNDQDFSAPFPSWGQFFLFNIIFFLGLSSLSLYFISLFSNGFIGIEKTIIMSSLFVLPLFFISALSFNGIKLSNYIIITVHFVFICLCVFQMVSGSESFFLDLFIIASSFIAIFLVQTKSYKNFVWYRSKHRRFLKNMKIKIKESGF